MSALRHKISGTRLRFFDVFRRFPVRLRRLVRHLKSGPRSFLSAPRKLNAALRWWSESLYLALDLAGIPEVYETLLDWIKYKTRPLTGREIDVARSVFGDSIQYARVRIDEGAYVGCRHFRFLYVSFYTINAWGAFNDEFLIHELVHVWQYEKFGGVYIPRAIRAIHSPEGYNYGGVGVLRQAVKTGKSFLDFNYEQQADIITDYYRLKTGKRPQWGQATAADLPVYAHFRDFLTNTPDKV